MPGMTPKTLCQFVLSALVLGHGPVHAGNADPEGYIGSNQLILEVRYCECKAVEPGSRPSDLLPGFLEESSLLKVAVHSDGKGFVSSHDVSIGYEFRRIKGSSGKLGFAYVGTFMTGSGSSSGQGQLLLEKGQWVHLFGSPHESENGTHHANVAVRLVGPA